jgi:hypothetical protein
MGLAAEQDQFHKKEVAEAAVLAVLVLLVMHQAMVVLD